MREAESVNGSVGLVTSQALTAMRGAGSTVIILFIIRSLHSTISGLHISSSDMWTFSFMHIVCIYAGCLCNL